MEEQEETTPVGVNDHPPSAFQSMAGPSTVATQDEHVSGQRVGEKRKTIDSESRYMANTLTNFDLLYGAKEDAKLQAQIQLNPKIA